MHHQSEVGLQQVVLGTLAVVDDEFELALQLRIHGSVVGGDLFLGKEACLDTQGEVDFLLGVQQGNLADLLQVVLDGSAVAPAA